MNIADCCDVCDALLTGAELAAGTRWGQQLCDICNQEYCEANGMTTIKGEGSMITTTKPGVLAVLAATSAGLHSVANSCTRSDLSTPMRERANEFDQARATVERLAEVTQQAYRRLEADCVRTGGSNGLVRDLRAALAAFRGEQAKATGVES